LPLIFFFTSHISAFYLYCEREKKIVIENDILSDVFRKHLNISNNVTVQVNHSKTY